MNSRTSAAIGIGMVVLGIIFGLYVGVWLCFVGGIVSVIEQIRAEHLSVLTVAWGIARVFLAGFFGWLTAIVLIAPGWVILQDA